MKITGDVALLEKTKAAYTDLLKRLEEYCRRDRGAHHSLVDLGQ